MRKIVAATEENKEEILKLYKIQLGREFCPWDDSYPGMKEIEFDLGRESLFVMIDGQEINADAGSKEDRIIAAISIDDDPQVERLDCWSHKLAPGAELSRLAVHPDFQNQKIARQMLVFGMEELARRGYKSVHFLVTSLKVRYCAFVSGYNKLYFFWLIRLSSPFDLICNFERNSYNLASPILTRKIECGRWVARRPGDVCSATTEAERRPWTHGDKVRFRF